MRLTSNATKAVAYTVMLAQHLCLLSLMGYGAVQAAPVNDICVNATPIAIGSKIEVNTTLATSASDGNCFSPGDIDYFGVWYTFDGTGERLIVESCPSSSLIAIFSGGCSSTSLTCVAGTIDSCNRERFQFDSVIGTTYYLLFQSEKEGLFDLTIFPYSVANDVCSKALQMNIGSTISINTTYATNDYNSTACDTFPVPGVWFTFTGTGDRLVARSCNSNFNYVSVAIFSGGCASTSQTCVAATMELCGFERFTFDTVAGMTYHVLVQSFFDELVNFTIFPYPPVANDVCTNATQFTVGSTVSVNTTYATKEYDLVPLDGCFSLSVPGVWYTFTGTGERFVVRGCSYNNYIYGSIFSGGCNSSTRQCVAPPNFNLCSRDRFMFDTVAGMTYHVLVQSIIEEIFDFSIFARPPVTNDFCENATQFTIGSTISVDTRYALQEYNLDERDDCIDDGNSLFPGLWYTFVGTGERLVVRACSYNNSVYVTIFSGGCGSASRTCVAATTRPCELEPLILDTISGTKYHVLVQSANDTNVDLSIFNPFMTLAPNPKPTVAPSRKPSTSKAPTLKPTVAPGHEPSKSPTFRPTTTPSRKPNSNSEAPILKQTTAPSRKPSLPPSLKPTPAPSHKPSTAPTRKPNAAPSRKPSKAPTLRPTPTPILKSTPAPILISTPAPTSKPCGLFRNSRFCPFAALLRFLRNLFGL